MTCPRCAGKDTLCAWCGGSGLAPQTAFERIECAIRQLGATSPIGDVLALAHGWLEELVDTAWVVVDGLDTAWAAAEALEPFDGEITALRTILRERFPRREYRS